MSLTEKRRGQRFCNRCEGVLIERFAQALRFPNDGDTEKLLKRLVVEAA